MNATHEIQLLIDAGALFVANHSGYMHASRIPLIELSTPVESQPQQLDLIA